MQASGVVDSWAPRSMSERNAILAHETVGGRSKEHDPEEELPPYKVSSVCIPTRWRLRFIHATLTQLKWWNFLKAVADKDYAVGVLLMFYLGHSTLVVASLLATLLGKKKVRRDSPLSRSHQCLMLVVPAGLC